MQGRGAGGITIGARKVDGHGEVDLTASHDVVQERVQSDYLGKARLNLIKNLIKKKRPQETECVYVCVRISEAVITLSFSLLGAKWKGHREKNKGIWKSKKWQS